MLRFRRLANTSLYSGEYSDAPPAGADHGQLLFILPSGTPIPSSLMSLEEAWNFQHPSLGAGYFLFINPGQQLDVGNSAQVAAYANRLQALLPRVIRNQAASLGWVTGTPADPTTLRLQVLNFVRVGDGQSAVVQTPAIPQVIRFQQVEVMILPATPFERAAGESGFVLNNTVYMAPPGADQADSQPTNRRIYMRGAAAHNIDKVGDTLMVPLSGSGRGSLQFALHELAHPDVDPGVMDIAMYYMVPESTRNRDQALRYPLLQLENPAGAAGPSATFNINARLYPQDHGASIFEFSEGPVLQTYFATFHGYPVHFAPLDGAGFKFMQVPNPGVYPSRAAEVQFFYGLTPVGMFELLVDNPTDEMEWLRGGSSGSEFVSFQPRRNGRRGDVIAFFEGQNGYAPDFVSISGGQTARRLQQATTPLLTDTFKTSWATVGYHPHETQDGRRNQYYAQPDDNVLHASGNSAPYLNPLEVAAADLPYLSYEPSDVVNSFPLTPLNGVIAPDERISPPIGMDKYVIFENEIMSPMRKQRISSAKLTSIATSNGHSLLQAPPVVKATTPQGMLVEVTGNAWGALTLAFDGTNTLKFADITDDFQDALQSNRLFMVASQENTLADAGNYTDDTIEITEWPFRVEVGKDPHGITPAADGLHRFNNVIIFKFVDKTFEDLVADSRVWARPEDFNADTSEIQTWLLEMIADAREKATNPDTAALYKPLVNDVLTNPGWNGVLAFNVTVPVNEMPCEVQGLLGGIRKLAEFKAHHVGFTISKVKPDASAIEKSSIFGLIDYEDNDPPTGGTPTPDYEFLVKTLKVRFANTEIADFNSSISLVMKKAFDERIRDPLANPEKVIIDTLDLEGKYQVFNGVPTYTFEMVAAQNPMEFVSDEGKPSLLHQMNITKVRFATSSCFDSGANLATSEVVSRFAFWGDLTFRSSANFDFFSFEKLVFSDLSLTMTFGFSADGTPQRPDPQTGFDFDPGNLRFDLSASKSRSNSLLSNFPLRLRSFHYAKNGLDIGGLGYLEIPNLVPGWGPSDKPDGSPAPEKPKYALSFILDMGPLSSSSAKKKPKGAIDIIAAWWPSAEGAGAIFGLRMAAGADGTKEIGIEGVMTIAVDNFGFMKIPATPADGEPYVYAFFIKSAFLKVVNTQIPPGGDFSLMLFVPYTASDTVNLSNLGWFVAYNRDGGSNAGGGSGSAPIDVEIQKVDLSATNNQTNPNTDVTISVVVGVKSSAIRPPEKIRITVKAEAVEGTTSRPLPPTPPSQEVILAIGQDNSTSPAQFVWPARLPGKYKFVATATVPGDLTPDDNTMDSAVLTVNEAAGKKEKRSIVQLDYLGIGHRVQLAPGDLEPRLLNTVEAVIDVMRNELVPAQTGNALREQLNKIYNPEGGILIGLDVTLFSVVRIAFLFAQSNELYGALIGFVDKAPKFLKGFQFQILYKKITDDIGVYQMVLKLPDFLRQFELGAASITLPLIGIDIYTNGNFKLDFGFPYNADFSRSFSIQMMAGPVPILGFAGFYFAYLTGATSTTVPQFKSTSLAKWDPVLEFGIGLSLGIGKTIEKGPLRAGASITIIVILEGALAWYHPPEGQAVSTLGSPPDWFRVKGQAGLQAQLYGIVDFGIIKVGIEVNASAIFMFVFESYKPIELGVTLSVSVRVTVVIGSFKIFGKTIRITISFSFGATFTFQFVVNNPMGHNPPWAGELLSNPTTPAFTRSLLQAGDLTPIEWVATQTVEGTPAPLVLTFAPQVTVAREDGNQYAHAVAGLTIGSRASSDFNTLLKSLTRWAIQSHTTGDLTLEDLLDLDTRLHIPRTLAMGTNNPSPLDWAEIRAFLKMNFSEITIKPMETFTGDDEPAGGEAVVFPMIPELRLVTSGQNGGDVDIDFGSHNPRNDAYQVNVADYFDELLVDVEHKTGIIPGSRELQQAPGPSVSMATIVLQDYFAFLIKSGVDRAVEYARSLEGASITLDNMLNALENAGDFDTVGKMASRFFFHGLRLPPEFDGSPAVVLSETAVPLYELTGQQVPIKFTPPVEPVDPVDEEDEGEPGVPSPPWTIALELNAATNDLIGLDAAGVELTIATDDTESRQNVALLEDLTPSLGGAVTVTQLPRLKSQPRHFSFANPTHVEVPDGTRAASLYPISQVLRDLLAERAGAVALTLHNEGDGVTPLGSLGTWALRINFSVKRVPRTVDGSGTPLNNTYVIGGTNEGTRNLIGKLLQAGAPSVSSMRLFFEVEGKSEGLVGQDLGGDPDVVLMKTNLSTVSAPQVGAELQAIAADDYSATMIPAQAQDFLRLLWEASIVNAPGYYLFYNNGASEAEENGLPVDIFGGQSNQANLTLLVTFASINDACNTLLIDSGSFTEGNLYATAPSELAWYPAIAPGAVAFELERDNPEAAGLSGAQAAIAPLFNLLSYYITAGDGFSESMHGLPVGPTSGDIDEAETPAKWTYRQGIKVHPYVENGSGNLYDGAGGTVTLGFEFLDIFGNVLEGAAPPQLEAAVRYTDRIKGVGQWPGVTAGYLFEPDGGSGKLTTTVSFASDIYTNIPDDAERVASALEAYLQIREQLEGPGVSASMTTTVAPDRSLDVKGTLLAFVNQVITYLGAPSPAPQPITTALVLTGISGSDRGVQQDNTFAVTTSVTIEREESRVDDEALLNMPEAQRSVTLVAPETTSGIREELGAGERIDQAHTQPMALEHFADEFETAFPELKVATGAGADGPDTIWAVRLADLGNVGITVNINNQPAFFAPAPLSNILEQREDVVLRTTNPASADPQTTTESFVSVDLDVWAREFLTEVDRFLAADLAVAGRQVNPGAYLTIVENKEKLAGAIASGVINVLDSAPGGAGYVDAAREAYKQSLLTRLSSAYEVATAVVYPVSVTNRGKDEGDVPARLYGNIKGSPVNNARLADYSFSTAKVDLDAGEGPKFTYLFTSERTAEQASAHLDINYHVTHVEHDIHPAVNGYEASSWLTLVLPDDTPMFAGRADIPIALREYPVPPTLMSQDAEPVDLANATTLDRATLWQYLYTYQQMAVAQDSIFTNVIFNVGPEVTRNLLQADSPDLFVWLARFQREYPLFKADLDLLAKGKVDLAAGNQTQTAANAVAWLADLVQGVADTWEAWVIDQAGNRQLLQDALEQYEWDFEVIERATQQGGRIEMVLPAGSNQSARFPNIELELENGDPLVITPSQSGGVASYEYPWSSADLPDTRQRRFIFPDLDVLHTENAWGGIRLARNLNLSSSAGNPPTTNPRFVYQTPEVRFVNKVTPLIDNKHPLEISRGATRDLYGHLEALLRELFGSAVNEAQPKVRLVKIGVRYAYDVRGQGGPALGPGQTDEFQAYLPVTQRMPFDLSPNNMGADIAALRDAVESWMASMQPSTSRGFYEFDISVFAALSNTDLPVLRLRRLWLGLDKIG